THWRTRLFGASRWSCAGVILIGLSGRISWLRSSTLTRSATRSRTRFQARSTSACELRTLPFTTVHNVPSTRNHRLFASAAASQVALASAERRGPGATCDRGHTCCTTSRGEEMLEAPPYKRCCDRAASEIVHGRSRGSALDALPDGCNGPRGRVAHLRRALRRGVSPDSGRREQPGTLLDRRGRKTALHPARPRRRGGRCGWPLVPRLRRILGAAPAGSRASGGHRRDRRARAPRDELRRPDGGRGAARAAAGRG